MFKICASEIGWATFDLRWHTAEGGSDDPWVEELHEVRYFRHGKEVPSSDIRPIFTPRDRKEQASQELLHYITEGGKRIPRGEIRLALTKVISPICKGGKVCAQCLRAVSVVDGPVECEACGLQIDARFLRSYMVPEKPISS